MERDLHASATCRSELGESIRTFVESQSKVWCSSFPPLNSTEPHLCNRCSLTKERRGQSLWDNSVFNTLPEHSEVPLPLRSLQKAIFYKHVQQQNPACALELTLGNTYILAGERLGRFHSPFQAWAGGTCMSAARRPGLPPSQSPVGVEPQVPPVCRGVPLPLMISAVFSNMLPCPAPWKPLSPSVVLWLT